MKQKLLVGPSDLHLHKTREEFVSDVTNGAENVIKLDKQKLCIGLQFILQLFRLRLKATKPLLT